MKEKILALLTAKFAGVRKDGLAQLAGALSFQATTDEEATALIDKLTTDSVNIFFVKDWRKEVDKEVSEANRTYDANLRKKFDFKEKTPEEPPTPPTPPTPGDDTPAWAKALIDQNKALADRLNTFEGGKIKETRLQQLQGKLDGLPESFKAQKLKDFSRMNFENEDSFTEYLTETETDISALNQELADKGLSGQGQPFFGKKNNDGTSSAVASFLESKKEGTGAFSGKEI